MTNHLGADGTIRPLRVVRVITRLNIGGPSLHAVLLTTRLEPTRFHSLLATGRPDGGEGDMGDLLERTGARRVMVPSLRRRLNPWADWKAWWQIFWMIRRERPDIVHTHMAKAGALGRTAALVHNFLVRLRRRKMGEQPPVCRIVHTFHGHVLEGYFSSWVSQLFVMIERHLARHTDCLIAVSQAVRDDLLKRGIGRPEQWRIIPLGLELSALAQLPLPAGAGAMRFGMVGRLVPIKNPALFLQAFERMVQRRPHAATTGVIVGDGPLRQMLEQEAKRLGLETLVQFTGWQRDLPRVYEGVEAACLTSWNEGTPVALIEAMAAGRAVVATDVGGVRDLLVDDAQSPTTIAAGSFRLTSRGVLVRPGDVEGLAAALDAVAGDEGLRQRLGRAARDHVTQRFSANRLCRDIEALYTTLVDGRAP